MALAYDGAIQRLIDSFASLPGIGPKGAQRIAFYLLQAPDAESQRLVDGSAKSAGMCAKAARAQSARIRVVITARSAWWRSRRTS